MTDFFSQLFTDLTTADSLIVLFFLFGSFLIGLLSGVIAYRKKWKSAEKDAVQYKNELVSITAEKDTLSQKLITQAQAYEKLNESVLSSKSQLQIARQEYQQLQNQLADSQQENESLKEQLAALKTTNQLLTEKELQLQSEVQQLQQQVDHHLAIQEEQQTEITQLTKQNQSGTALGLARLELLERKILQLENKAPEIATGSDEISLTDINKRLLQLENENQDLKTALAQLQEGEEEIEVILDSPVVVQTEKELEKEIPEEYNFISSEEKSEAARLQAIDGIGPFIEEQLNSIGIFTFEQISLFDKQVIELVTDAIQFFPGRIERDDWKGQAAAFFGS